MFETLDREAIFAFFKVVPVGRLGTYDPEGSQVQLTPILFAFENGQIYFSTQAGRKLEAIRRNPQGLCLQAEEVTATCFTSVLGFGQFAQVSDPLEATRALALLAEKYRERFVGQVFGQVQVALRKGPEGLLSLLRDSVIGRIDLQRVSGRRWKRA